MTAHKKIDKEENLFTILLNKFYPYWPLFVALIVLFFALAWSYLRFATPAYEITASMVIIDQQKGVNDPRITESINSFDSNKIVENEIEVIQSRDLVREVVYELDLYAPVSEEKRFKSISAYQSSPIKIKLKSPENFPDHIKSDEKFYISYDSVLNQVTFNDKVYPINVWVKTSLGDMQFAANQNFSRRAKGPLYFNLVHPKVVTNDIMERLTVNSASKESSVIDLELVDESPERGEDILNLLIAVYNREAANDKKRLAANTLDFIESRIRTVEKEIDALESRIEHYKTSNDIVDLSEQGKVYLQNVSLNDQKLADINIQLAVLERVERNISLQDSSSSIVPATLGVQDNVLTQLLTQLQIAESEYQKLKRTTAENNPTLSSIVNEISRTRRNILKNIQNQRESLEASRANLASTKNKYMAALQLIPIRERELLEISRQQATKKNVYNLLLETKEETALLYTHTNLDNRVVEEAQASIKPVSPKRLVAYAAALVLALAAGAVWVLGKELLGSKVMFRSDIEDYTNAPVVAEISRVKMKKPIPFSALIEPIAIEQFRQLRVSLGLYGKTISKHKILVTSSIPGEGKSFISANLAYTLAAAGKKVILLDLDMRMSSISKLFQLEGEKGVSDYLTEDAEIDDIIKISQFNSLHVVSAGTTAGDYSDMLLDGALDGMFEQLGKLFDYIIVDSPPLDMVTDGYLLSNYCDISLLVIRHNYTPKSVLQGLEQSNKQHELHNLAIVFNDVMTRGFINGASSLGYGYGKYNKEFFKPTYRHRFIKNSA